MNSLILLQGERYHLDAKNKKKKSCSFGHESGFPGIEGVNASAYHGRLYITVLINLFSSRYFGVTSGMLRFGDRHLSFRFFQRVGAFSRLTAWWLNDTVL
jgi:hypothetical protein